MAAPGAPAPVCDVDPHAERILIAGAAVGGGLGALEAALRHGGLPLPGDGHGGGGAGGGDGGGAQQLARIVGNGGGAAAAAPAAAPIDDARALPILIGDDGVWFREFRGGVRMLQESAWRDWPVRGPPTVHWVRLHARPRGHPDRSPHSVANDVPPAAAGRRRESARMRLPLPGAPGHLRSGGRDEHRGRRDLSRQVQLVEEKWKDRVSGSLPTGDIEHDSHLYLGTGMSRGDLRVCPLLQAWIAEQLSAESAILKEQRKAREERTLTRGGGGGSVGGGNHGDGEKGGKKKTDDKK